MAAETETSQYNSGCLFLMLAAQVVVQPVPRVTLCTGFSLAVLVVLLSLTPVRRNVEQSESPQPLSSESVGRKHPHA